MSKFDQTINDWCKRFEQAVAEEATRVLTEQAAVVMKDDYYDEFEPDVYDRIDNFKGSYSPYSTAKEGGVKFSASNMSDYPKMGKGFTKESIFEYDISGEHGGAYHGTSPYESLQQFAESVATLSSIAEYAVKKAGNMF